MQPFHYRRADSLDAAAQAAGASRGSRVEAPVQFVAGGTTLLDLMKIEVMRPATVIDINPLADRYGAIDATDRGLRLGALARMAQAADDPAVRRDYPVIAQTLDLAASQQLRNMATLGGNLLQRTRCPYFRDVSWTACNKRDPGSGCAALEGVNRKHAVLGVSEACIATYPGDFAQALVALDARLEIAGPQGRREIAAADLHRLPGETPNVETQLGPGELITSILVPAGAWTRRSLYLKVRDRESYDFALASAAVALELGDDDTVREARIALGGVATVPWRARAAEDALKGRRLDEAAAEAAAEAAFADAQIREHNAYKVDLGRRTLVRALLDAARLEIRT
ncbi:xanthine dehydrogenase family protein subunit M [Rhodoplanes sp. TEM]|uniref:Xanthine dehydrogenase family protein subunit M n=1 Tax=Rhodoplanes tepidamans TaxID=200616 RepID=A0ABT5JFA0_RHOTP|nr:MULTISPECIES: xanthine dehydrogenase family protein subunit M [Rhodoplanes]MDC7788368.1 xanthine dehydrogenase family protein subunit M [Rhodoplanes tepidamans]MDC7985351.1 xanthine dehydrogenase family protein subunit M [Rhodoplanes sp. TEM]MDQ0357133.1 xanthine dehydrogenase YagS FAD-binding subunit [Rhodoplanes tepidamans]